MNFKYFLQRPAHSGHRYRQGAFSAVLAILLAASGCYQNASSNLSSSQKDQEESVSLKTIEITDDLGRTVSIGKPERAAILLGSFADMWVEAGGQDSLCAAAHDAWTQFDLPLDQSADLGDVKNISLETLIEARPDVVIASAKNDSQKALKDNLDDLGIPVLYFDVSSFEDYLRVLEQMSRMTGDAKAYEKAGSDIAAEMEAIQSLVPDQGHPKVLALRATGKGVKALNDESSVLGAMLHDLQAENIASQGMLDTLSAEEIIDQDPDMIFLVFQGSDLTAAKNQASALLEQSQAWDSLRAVQNGNVYVLNGKYYNLKPNENWARAYASLYQLVYPEENHEQIAEIAGSLDAVIEP